MTADTARSQTAMKRLAGALSLVCLVLFLLAIEQKHAMAVWQALRDGTGPAVRQAADWAGDLPSGVAGRLRDIRAAVAGQAATPGDSRADDGSTNVDAGAAVGSLTLVGAELRFENGETLRTRPLRIARGRDFFTAGQTFSRRLDVPADAQIELREVVAPGRGQVVPPISLCGGEPARAAAVLQRPDRIELMLFRTRTVGIDSPPAALCGVWSFSTR